MFLFCLSKTTHQTNARELEVEGELASVLASKSLAHMSLGGMISLLLHSVVLGIAKIADFRDTENSMNFHCYKIPLIDG